MQSIADLKSIFEKLTSTPSSGSVDVALVLDRSGSMGGSRIRGAKLAAKFFATQMETGDNLAVASFSSFASVDFGLTRITSDATITEAQNAIDAISAGGSTSIGAGIQEGQAELDKGNTGSTQGMVLLSDGYENSFPFVSSVLPTIPDNTNIYTIALGTNADDDLLKHIADETGGIYRQTPSADELQDIYERIRFDVIDFQLQTQQSGEVRQGTAHSTPAIIDRSSSTTRIQASWQSPTGANKRSASSVDLDLILEDPDGRTIDPDVAATDPNIRFSSGTTSESYTVTNPVPGVWNLTVKGVNVPGDIQPYTLSVASESDLTMDVSFDRPSYPPGENIFVSAELTDEETPITGATVTADVVTPTAAGAKAHRSAAKQGGKEPIPSAGKTNTSIRLSKEGSSYVTREGTAFYTTTTDLKLYDDGVHGDGAADDGVYANFFDATNTEGSYTFEVEAEGTAPNSGAFMREASRSTVVSSTAPTEDCPGTLGITYFDADQGDDPDTEEFVEITNQGSETASLDECALVFYDGANSASYFATQLSGVLPAEESYVVGNSGNGDINQTFPDNTMQDGPDAVSLYRDQASNFSDGTAVTVENLISAVVYIDDETYQSSGVGKRETGKSPAEVLLSLEKVATETGQSTELPQEFALQQNYPNPFNPSTTIRFGLPETAHVRLTIYDVTGRTVQKLTSREMDAGWHQVQWKALHYL